jgi:hypothetical protein
MMAILKQKQSKEIIQKKEVVEILSMLHGEVFTPRSLSRNKTEKNSITLVWRKESEMNLIGIQIENVLLKNFKAGRQYYNHIAESLSTFPIIFFWISTKEYTIHFYPIEKKIWVKKTNEEKFVFFDQNLLETFQQKISQLFEEMQTSHGVITLTER